MKSIILAAGYATRMYPLTLDTPKPLLPVRGKAILDWTLEDLLPLTQECTVVTNALFAPRFTAWAEKYEGKIRVLNDGTDSNGERRGAVGDLLFAVQSLRIREDVFVMGADNLLDFSLEGFFSFAKEKQASCVMYGREPDREKRKKTGIITIDRDGKITDFAEKPDEPASDLAVPPFYYYRAEDIARLPEAVSGGCGTDTPGSFAAWVSRESVVYAWKMTGKRFAVGDAEAYRAVQETFQGRIPG
ncbi:MAG: nucleotidyltransferase family protein [Clostridia bacterium]|nr:nucleotidyltransferase family protein [Clostridia bacterium]